VSQITHGVRAIFSSPRIYDGFQDLMGASRARQELVREFIRPAVGTRLLDIGCGTAAILSFLPQRVEYWGYDISAPYIQDAKNRFGARGHFHCGLFDALELDRIPKLDVVIAIGVLHHLDDSEAIGLFELARRALKRDGRAITMDPCFAHGQNPVARFLIGRDRGQNVRTADRYMALPRPHFGQIKGQLRHRAWIPYTHWIMECTK
jgi:SAM-dependent methyltransferase